MDVSTRLARVLSLLPISCTAFKGKSSVCATGRLICTSTVAPSILTSASSTCKSCAIPRLTACTFSSKFSSTCTFSSKFSPHSISMTTVVFGLGAWHSPAFTHSSHTKTPALTFPVRRNPSPHLQSPSALCPGGAVACVGHGTGASAGSGQ